MTYQVYGLNLTKGQVDKLQRAAKKSCPVSTSLTHANLRYHKMLLTFRGVQKITKLIQQGTGGMNLEMSAALLKGNMKKEDGFLPMLDLLASTALPILAKTVFPALGVGALSVVGSADVSNAMGSGLYLKPSGCVCTKKPSGNGLYMKPSAVRIVQGDGYYLKRG